MSIPKPIASVTRRKQPAQADCCTDEQKSQQAFPLIPAATVPQQKKERPPYYHREIF